MSIFQDNNDPEKAPVARGGLRAEAVYVDVGFTVA